MTPTTTPAALHESVTARLRAAGCVFAEEEATLLLEAAAPRPSGAATSPPGAATSSSCTDTSSSCAESQYPAPTTRGERLERLVSRRVAGEPLEHVLGWVSFTGHRWAVAPGVFVPRQRSELLVTLALAAVRPTTAPVVVDLCCGNGALGGAVAAALLDDDAGVVLHAADIEPAATACAAQNLAPLGGVVHTGDLYAALPVSLRGRVDLLLCHAPYVPTAAIALMPPEAREHEPLTALDGGPDGLEVLRRAIWEATAWLAPGGAMLFELGDERQLATTQALLEREGLRATVHEDDETGATVVVARPSR